MRLPSRVDGQDLDCIRRLPETRPSRSPLQRSPSSSPPSDAYPEADLPFDAARLPAHIWARIYERASIRGKLRLSLTEHCNYRCFFCHNEGQGPVQRRASQALNVGEFVTIVRVALAEGATKVKLTGGEPLLYRTGRDDIVSLVASLSGLRSDSVGFDFSLTTNGSLMAEYATRLRAAGLDRATISLTTLNTDTFKSLIAPNVSLLDRSVAGLKAAYRAGLVPLKLNAVLYQSSHADCGNLDELCALIEMAAETGVEEFRIFTLLWHEDFPRFDEFYQFFSAGVRDSIKAVLVRFGVSAPTDTVELLARLGTAFSHRMYPKVEFGVSLGQMKLGFEAMKYARLASESGFQEGPYAIRVAADGALRSTLTRPPSYDLINAVRRGASETELRSLYNEALEEMP
jgi:cyclic pyranopterin phosphate synthase